jgi:hypothetical protein
MAFNARTADATARSLMSGKRSTRTASQAAPRRLSVSRLPQGSKSKKDAVQRNDREMTSRMSQAPNIGS